MTNLKFALLGAFIMTGYAMLPQSDKSVLETPLDSLNQAYQDTIKFERYWNELLMTNNKELHEALMSRMGYEQHMKHILGLPLNDSMDYYDKLRVKIETTDLVGSNSIPQAHKGIHASKR